MLTRFVLGGGGGQINILQDDPQESEWEIKQTFENNYLLLLDSFIPSSHNNYVFILTTIIQIYASKIY